MIRVVVFLLLVGLVALGAAWLADRPGDIAITWQGYRIETSVMVGVAAVLATAALAVLAWSIVRLVLRSPDLIGRMLGNRRRDRGYRALTGGLIAVGAGDARAARRFAAEARRLAGGEPLALLLQAQTAQLAGDRPAAEAAFRAMAARGDTRLLGLRGLYVEAQRRDDLPAARAIAEEAVKTSPAAPWAGQAVLEFRCAGGDWAGALEMLDRNLKSGLVAKPAFRRQRAVLLTTRALAAEDGDHAAAKTLALEAVRLAPDLVPAAALAGRLLAEGGELRKAGKVLEAAWKAHPHPDLAEAYAHLRIGDSARDRLARAQTLARHPSGHVEGALAVARAAIDAREFALARDALAPFVARPTQRVALLMAEIAQDEHGDEGRAREWMGRALRAERDPSWTADGYVSDRWLPLSPVTGRLDAFQWKVPLAAIGETAPVIDEVAETPAVGTHPAGAAPPPGPGRAPEPRHEPATAPTVAVEPGTIPPLPAGVAAAPATAVPPATGLLVAAALAPAVEAPSLRRPASTEAVIPLVHAPDDPGPDGELEEDAGLPPDDGWRRLRSLFR